MAPSVGAVTSCNSGPWRKWRLLCEFDGVVLSCRRGSPVMSMCRPIPMQNFSPNRFERGFGTTVGNSLRRILLSSLEGAAVTHIRLKGAEHEFSSLAGVMEDVTDIILNIKSLVVKLETDDVKEIKLVANKAGQVTAGMIETDPSVHIINKDLVIATLTEDVSFELTLTVSKGRGYVTASENIADEDEQEIGTIAVDSIYSPVTRVRYSTEDARVGQKTDYDRLILEIWTNGTTHAGNGIG